MLGRRPVRPARRSWCTTKRHVRGLPSVCLCLSFSCRLAADIQPLPCCQQLHLLHARTFVLCLLSVCSCPTTTQRCPVTTQRCPVIAQRCPVTAQRCAVTAQRCPVTTQRCPVTAQRCPAFCAVLPCSNNPADVCARWSSDRKAAAASVARTAALFKLRSSSGALEHSQFTDFSAHSSSSAPHQVL